MVLTTRRPNLSHIYQVKITQKEFDERRKHDDEVVFVKCFSFKEALKKVEKNEIYVGFHNRDHSIDKLRVAKYVRKESK